ncbi:MAG: sensor histidine kinase [Acidimicrobiales bacterium]
MAPQSPTDALAAWGQGQQDRLASFIRADSILTLGSAVYVFGIYLFAATETYLLAASGATLVAGAIMALALRSARQGRISEAVARLAGANWFVVTIAALLAAPVWPVLVLAAVLPATAAASYVDAGQFQRYLGGSVVVSGACTGLGLFVSVTPIEDDVPDWAIESVLAIFVPLLTAMVGLLALQNFTRMRAAMGNLIQTHGQLQLQSDALRAARTRMVAAANQERRRIERDLHYGTQQHFVAMGLKVGAIRRAVRAGDESSGRLIDELKDEIKSAQSQLRELTLGIYPPTLTQHGLAAALERAVDQIGLDTRTGIDNVGRHDSSIEASVYFICLEALHNAEKHAGPDATVSVRLSRVGDRLRFIVSDTGLGFDTDTVAVRSGTQNMQDRIATVYGSLVIDSVPGQGTTVVGEVPLG